MDDIFKRELARTIKFYASTLAKHNAGLVNRSLDSRKNEVIILFKFIWSSISSDGTSRKGRDRTNRRVCSVALKDDGARDGGTSFISGGEAP